MSVLRRFSPALFSPRIDWRLRSALLAVRRPTHQIAPQSNPTAAINRAYPGANPIDRRTTMYPAAASNTGSMIIRYDRFIAWPVPVRR